MFKLIRCFSLLSIKSELKPAVLNSTTHLSSNVLFSTSNSVTQSFWANCYYFPKRSIFIHRSGDLLWEGVTGPPGRIKKRARGKRRVVRNKIDLNVGRVIGDNKLNIKWPGLNSPVDPTRVNEKASRVLTGDKLIELRNKQNKRRFSHIGVPPLKRGWTGGRIGGQSLGRPDPVIGQDWDGFDSRVLELKSVCTMTAVKGRFRQISAIVMAGNGKGLAGIGKAKSVNMKTALNIAKNRAVQRLEFYDLYESRTIWHPGHSEYWRTSIYARPLPQGHGLICHRMIKTMCQLIGIKDLYAKVEGNTKNYQTLSKAFQGLLRRQEDYQQIANRLSLNVVGYSVGMDNFPQLLAAPSSGETKPRLSNEDLNFDRLHLDGRVFFTQKKRPFYLNLPGPKKNVQIRHIYRNQERCQLTRKVYGYLASEGFLSKVNLISKK